MPAQKISDLEIRSFISEGKTNNWIHTNLKVGMDRIKKLRDIEAIQPTQPTYLPTDEEEVIENVSPAASPTMARGIIEPKLWFCITQAELKKLPEWLLHRVIKRC